MTGGHLNDFELLEVLYGLGPPADHLERCPQCRERYDELVLRRKQLLATEPELEWQRLARQREAILRAATRRELSTWAQVAPILAVAALAVVAVGLSTFSPPAPNFHAGTAYEELVSDSELWEEVYAVLRNPQPAALEPVRELFEAEP